MEKTQITFTHNGHVVRLKDNAAWQRFLERHLEGSTFAAVLDLYIQQHPGAVEKVDSDGAVLT